MAPCEPCFEATVHPSFALFMRGDFRAGSAGPLQEDTGIETGVPATVAPDRDVFPIPSSSTFETVILRQDGTRPVRTVAALVWDAKTRVDDTGEPERALDRRVRLYLGRDGQVLAQLSYRPSEAFAARPVFQVEAIASAGDLADLLSARPPELCFAVGGEADPSALPLCSRLRAIPAIYPSLAHAEASV